MSIQTLTPEQLYTRCSEDWLNFTDTAELTPLTTPIAQDRAVSALDFGVAMPHDGYNLFVSGSVGVGKYTLVNDVLQDRAAEQPVPQDWCYLHNFDQPHRPIRLALPAGMGVRLKKDMEMLLYSLLVSIPDMFRSDDYRNRMIELRHHYEQRESQAFSELIAQAKAKDIAIMRTPQGYTLGPLRQGKLLSQEDYDRLPEEDKTRLTQAMEEANEALKSVLQQLPKWQEALRAEIDNINEECIVRTVGPVMTRMKTQYQDFAGVQAYLDAVQHDLVANAEEFFQPNQRDNEDNLRKRIQQAEFKRYQINLLVDHQDSTGAPVLHEPNPTFKNLIGRIEHVAQFGALLTDFTLIKPGALHQANGGYLILDAQKLLASPFAWGALKRALRARDIRLESIEDSMGLTSTISLEPQPIPLQVKVILLGSRFLYYLLDSYDPEFSLLFKVHVDFAEDYPQSAEQVGLYARMIASLVKTHALLPFERSAVANVIEQGARQVEHAGRLLLHMGRLEDLLREADFWARRAQAERVSREHVSKAVAQRIYRASQAYERHIELVLSGVRLIDTEGMRIGQINGLSVISFGDVWFGQPSRITATVRAGAGRIVDIERETEMGGKLHTKGVLILSSLLSAWYGDAQPLSLAASLVFEQSYAGVDGDSASTAELCALLSAIGRVPLKQSLAITGSIDQLGDIQAIGGINEKIEGFFDVCKARGLTGEQGVILPQSNVQHLMLREDVVQAVAAGTFHLYGMTELADAMTLLTGLPFGCHEDAQEGTVNALIKQQLAAYTERARLRDQTAHSASGEVRSEPDGSPPADSTRPC